MGSPRHPGLRGKDRTKQCYKRCCAQRQTEKRPNSSTYRKHWPKLQGDIPEQREIRFSFWYLSFRRFHCLAFIHFATKCLEICCSSIQPPTKLACELQSLMWQYNYMRDKTLTLDWRALGLKDSLGASEGDEFRCLASVLVRGSPLLGVTYHHYHGHLANLLVSIHLDSESPTL